MSIIKTERIDGLGFQYIVVHPSRLDLEFSIGSTVKQLGSNHEAAINFSYADTDTGTPIGRLVVDGVTVIQDSEKTKNRDLFYVAKSGTAHIGPYPRTPIQWAVQGSPRLLMNGKNVLKRSITRDKTPSDITSRKAQRTAVGIRKNGDVVLLVTDTMMTLDELSRIMWSLGCLDALNGDGGGSSYLWPEDNGWGRKVGAAIVVKKEDRKNMKVVIDAGHFPDTPGKRTPDDSMREYHFNSVVANYVVEGLKEYENVETLETHEDDRDVPLRERADMANAWKADVFVSIHANAAPDNDEKKDGWSEANGIETFTYINPSRASTALAVSIQRNMISATGLEDRGVKTDNLFVVRETNMPAVLVECGFMTNRKESELLKSDEYRRKCAKAIVKSLVEIYGLKKKETVKIPTNDQVPTIQRRVNVQVNERLNTTGYLIDNTAYVPIRLISEAFGAKVNWNDGNPVQITKEVK